MVRPGSDQGEAWLHRLLTRGWVYECCQRMAGNRRAYETLVSQYIRPSPGMRILDIGCGTAEITRWLGVVDYSGFDPNPNYIEKAQTRGEVAARTWCGSISAPGLDGEKYDLILGLGVLHHVDDDLALRFFELAARHLEPSGRVVTVDPCLYPSQPKPARLAVSLDRGRWVRSPQEYERFARKQFSNVEVAVRDDLLNVPYSHAILSST